MKPSRTETIRYIATMLQELAALSKSDQFLFLTYLIEMAFIEANDLAHKNASETKATFNPKNLNGSEHS